MFFQQGLMLYSQLTDTLGACELLHKFDMIGLWALWYHGVSTPWPPALKNATFCSDSLILFLE